MNFRRICVLVLQEHGMVKNENPPKISAIIFGFSPINISSEAVSKEKFCFYHHNFQVTPLHCKTDRAFAIQLILFFLLSGKRLHRLLRSYSIVIKLGENFCFTEVSRITSIYLLKLESWKFTFWTENQVCVSIWKEEHKGKNELKALWLCRVLFPGHTAGFAVIAKDKKCHFYYKTKC